MAVVKCSRQHFYDDEKYSECPHCARLAQAEEPGSWFGSDEQEVQQAGSYISDFIRQSSLELSREVVDAPQASSMQQQAAHVQMDEDDDDDFTIILSEQGKEEQAHIKNEADMQPGQEEINRQQPSGGNDEGIGHERLKADCTAGWLVCIEGRDYGKDFSLHAGFNRIGRDAGECDIILRDQSVSESEHCAVFYDDRKNVFYLFPNADYSSYIDGQPAASIQEIKSRQVIRLGDTRLEFVAFCAGDKSWR